MKNYIYSGLISALVSILLPLSSTAAPNTISYSGKLLGKDGVTLKGTQIVEFSICDQISAGTCPWKEQQSVNFNNGNFSIQLGSVTSLPASIFES